MTDLTLKTDPRLKWKWKTFPSACKTVLQREECFGPREECFDPREECFGPQTTQEEEEEEGEDDKEENCRERC